MALEPRLPHHLQIFKVVCRMYCESRTTDQHKCACMKTNRTCAHVCTDTQVARQDTRIRFFGLNFVRRGHEPPHPMHFSYLLAQHVPHFGAPGVVLFGTLRDVNPDIRQHCFKPECNAVHLQRIHVIRATYTQSDMWLISECMNILGDA